MCFEPIGAHGSRLVAVAGLHVDCRDDPVLGDLLCDAPGALLLTGLDILARDETEEADVVVRRLTERSGLGRGEDSFGVVHKPCDKGVARALVGPLDDWLSPLVARRRERGEGSCRD